MKIIIESQSLLKNLNVLNRVIPSNSTLPIIMCFLFRVLEGKLVLVATDLEVTLEIETAAQSTDDGIFAVSANLMMEIIKALPDQLITLQFSESGLEIQTLSGNYNMAVEDASTFPKTPVVETSKTTSISAHILNKAFSMTTSAISNDDLKIQLTGVCVDFQKNKLVFVSTDGNKLAKYTRLDLKSDDEYRFIIPKKPIQVLMTALSGKDTEVEIGSNETNAMFSFDEITMICRLVDAKYPNYEAVIPIENPDTLEINRSELLGSLKRILIFSDRSTNQIILDKKGNSLTIHTENIAYHSKGVETLTCIGCGNDLIIGFNARFLVEMLGNISSDKIKILMSGPTRPALMNPLEITDQNEDVTMLVMPVALTTK